MCLLYHGLCHVLFRVIQRKMSSIILLYFNDARASLLSNSTECYVFFFFFSSRRRHTRLQGDWSSDVCSSDLVPRSRLKRRGQPLDDPLLDARIEERPHRLGAADGGIQQPLGAPPEGLEEAEIGRASCRERV